MDWKTVSYSALYGALFGFVGAIPVGVAYDSWTPLIWTTIIVAVIKGAIAALPEPKTTAVNGKNKQCTVTWQTAMKKYA